MQDWKETLSEIVSNPGFIIVASFAIVGFPTSETPWPVFAICLIYWSGIGVALLQNALITGNQIVRAHQGSAIAKLFLQVLLWGPFAYRVLEPAPSQRDTV